LSGVPLSIFYPSLLEFEYFLVFRPLVLSAIVSQRRMG
jgi:hypothetical protein